MIIFHVSPCIVKLIHQRNETVNLDCKVHNWFSILQYQVMLPGGLIWSHVGRNWTAVVVCGLADSQLSPLRVIRCSALIAKDTLALLCLLYSSYTSLVADICSGV